MGLTKFKILFDNPQHTYYPGQTVTGQILFSVNSTRKVHGNIKINLNKLFIYPINYLTCILIIFFFFIIKGIKLTVKGDAITTWAAYESGGTMSRAVTLTGQEQYFHYKYYILGSAFGNIIYKIIFSIFNLLKNNINQLKLQFNVIYLIYKDGLIFCFPSFYN